MKKFIVRDIPDELHNRIKVLAAQLNTPMNDIMKTAIELYADNLEKSLEN